MRNKQILTTLFIFTLVLTVLLPLGTARAEIYEVTNINNSGAGSLRKAINDAYNHAGADTITFAATTNGTSIDLIGAANEDANTSGDLDILDGGDLTIQGNGAANTIIDGGGNDRVFHVCPGGGCTNSVTFNGVTIRNGSLAIGVGGGIFTQADGTTTVDGSAVISNTATYGGGICNHGTLNVRNGSTIGGAGAGNQANEYGGGIFNDFGGITTVDSSIVSANTADKGSGIYNNAGGTTTLDSSDVISNTASKDGGGIYNKGTLSVTNGSAIGRAGARNLAGVSGGGIYNDDGGTTTVDGSTVSANSATSAGGIFNMGILTIQNDSTIGGTGAGNAAGPGFSGGGIFNFAGSTTVTGSTISANFADNGGGIYNVGTLNITDSTIGGTGAGNTATDSGGGIYNMGTLNVTNGSTISANSATYSGGGVFNQIGGASMTTVDGSIVNANTAKYGGGIYNRNTLNITNSTIGSAGAGNQATIWGGGIFNQAGSTTITGSCILYNRATINGGGLYNDENTFGAIDVTGSNIAGNSVTSFFNNQAAMQTATGNWWGAATGPNTSGADTAGGNVDTGGFLTRPIPCLELDSFFWPLFLPAIIGKERP